MVAVVTMRTATPNRQASRPASEELEDDRGLQEHAELQYARCTAAIVGQDSKQHMHNFRESIQQIIF